MTKSPILFSSIALRLHKADTVAVALRDIPAGTTIVRNDLHPPEMLEVLENIPSGHKLALSRIHAGAQVKRYGHVIGLAGREIPPGSWVHTHNLESIETQRDSQVRVVASQEPPQPGQSIRSFLGYPHPSGRAGTRNYIAVISTVSCSAQAARAIAAHFTPERLAAYPHVDGVIAVTHGSGCSIPEEGLSHVYLRRALLNIARHPNVGASLFISLGCEVNQMAAAVAALVEETGDQPHPVIGPHLTIQELGGIHKTVAAGIRAVEELLPQADQTTRQPVPLSELCIALQCGGSDGWSGVTANPLVGQVSDRVVAQGGTVVLGETPEIYGAEQLLTGRSATQEVGQKLLERVRWWEQQAQTMGFSLDNNPSPGNKAGGLTTIYEKSLGAVVKGGSAPLQSVYEYAERVTGSGLTFMDTPGNDLASISGQVAGGANLVLFTTGRGSVSAGILAPCLKIATNTGMYARMQADMDFNAGALLDGLTMEAAAQDLLDLVVETASGSQTHSESFGFREGEFVPWQPGAML